MGIGDELEGLGEEIEKLEVTKGLKKGFGKTPLGRSMLWQVIISTVFALAGLLVTLVMYFNAADKYGNRIFLVFDNEKDLTVIALVTLLLIILACYFDGKRDGAIAQFKARNAERAKQRDK